MKAWFLKGPNELVLEETAEPALQPGFVVAEVLTAQGSVTEAGMLSLEGDTFGLAEKVQKMGKVSVPGHECVVRIVKTNPGSKYKEGDRVTTLVKIPCEACSACKTKSYRFCRQEHLLGVSLDGVFAERVALPEAGLLPVSDKISNCEAANLQPLSDCVAAVDSVSLKLGMTVVVFGAGCLGMSTMQVANAAGAGRVIVVDVKEENLKTAKELGASVIINGMEEDAVSCIMELTGGRGADIVFDCAGGNPKRGLAGLTVLNQAVKAVKPEGEVLILAHYGPAVEFPIGEMRNKGKNLIMPNYATMAHLKRAADLVELGVVKIEPLVGCRLDGIEQVPKMFEITGNKANSKTINPAQVNIKE